MKRIFLVSCVGKKLPKSAMAKDLYISDWFKKTRILVENSGSDWFILSAKYGLVKSDKTIEPYDKTLNNMPKREREEWAKNVIANMKTDLPKAEEVVLLAGMKYREFLMEYLEDRFDKVHIPMKGLGIGKQISWLKYNSGKYRA